MRGSEELSGTRLEETACLLREDNTSAVFKHLHYREYSCTWRALTRIDYTTEISQWLDCIILDRFLNVCNYWMYFFSNGQINEINQYQERCCHIISAVILIGKNWPMKTVTITYPLVWTVLFIRSVKEWDSNKRSWTYSWWLMTRPRPRTLVSFPQWVWIWVPGPSLNANTFVAIWLDQKPMGWARTRTHVSKFIIGFDTLIDWRRLFRATPLVPLVTTNDFNDGSVRLKHVVNDRAVKVFCLSRQARWL